MRGLGTEPKSDRAQDIYDNIAENGDNSVAGYFDTGWLLCDDGSGEDVDFLHLDEGTLTSIDVKGANNKSDRRHISLTVFEQVASQARRPPGCCTRTCWRTTWPCGPTCGGRVGMTGNG
jgi:hypothetical protein